MEMQINVNTKIIYMDSAVPVMRAIENVKRDIRKVCCDSDEKGCDIVLIMENMQAEQFEIKCDNNMLVIYASDTLGFVYGLYHISRDILGVLPFWFWNDQVFIKKKGCRISGEYAYTSKPYAVKYRGWFVNDEVLIHKWYVDRKKDMPWEMVFEALLRCGGNLVIPGTDKNSHIYRDLAADMGLRITHHHAEPLGAPMFARRYPELTPSYDEYPEKFHELWKEGIDEQKKLDVIWNLGFRGQGDCPFWDNDPRYQTSESRGELMGKLIGLQRDYVQNEIPDAQYCTNLYGETMELYRDGYLKLPDDVIKIWADNGFGKMVTRRQGNHNPRIPALPKENNTGRHGIYYHVSFYDLQAANHITMLPNKPKLVHSELKKVLEHHVKDYWIINCSNVKPHVYYLDFIANMWRDGDVDIDKHLKGYIASYYGEDHITEIAECFRQYWQHALKYGEHEDDHAGEQFANHVARMLISQFMKDKSQRAEDLLWACDDKTLEGQVEWYKKLCAKGKESYEQLLCCYEKLDARLIDHERILFEDSLYLQAEIYYNCYSGALGNILGEILQMATMPLFTYVDDMVIFAIDVCTDNSLSKAVERTLQEFARMKSKAIASAASLEGDISVAHELYKQLLYLFTMVDNKTDAGLLCYPTQNEAESNTYYFDFDRLKSSDRYDNILFEITLAMKKLQSIGLSNDEKQRIFEAFIVTWSSYVGSEKLKLLNIGGINSDESAITEMSRWIAETLNIYETGKEKERMEKILDVIYSNFDNTELNIQYIAKNILFMNEDYFGRVFIRNMHLKFSAYLEQSRIEMAKRLLEYNPDMRIAMLTELIGYPADGQYFSKTFRKVCGMTPTEYRENLKKTDI